MSKNFNELIEAYKDLLADAYDRGITLSDIEIMEELGVDVETLDELKLQLENESAEDREAKREQIREDLDDEMELSIDERTYDDETGEEEPYVPEEEESEGYYEDMNENQLAEIEEAAEEEAKREKEAADKAEKAKKDKKKREEAAKKKHEEQLRAKTDQENKEYYDKLASSKSQTEPETIAEQNDSPAVVPVEENYTKAEDRFKKDEEYSEPQKSTPSDSEHFNVNEPPYGFSDKDSLVNSTKQYHNGQTDKKEYVDPVTEPVPDSYSKPVSEPVQDVHYKPVVEPVSNEYEKSNTPVHESEKAAEHITVPVETVVEPVSVPSQQTTPSYDHNTVLEETDNSDYSRAHTIEKNEAVSSQENNKKQTQPEIKEEKPAVAENVTSGAHSFKTDNGNTESVTKEPVNVQSVGSEPSHNQQTAGEAFVPTEDKYYTPMGVPVSVETRVQSEYEKRVDNFYPGVDNYHIDENSVTDEHKDFNTVYENTHAVYEQTLADNNAYLESLETQLKEMKASNASTAEIQAMEDDIKYYSHKAAEIKAEKLMMEEAVASGSISAEAVYYMPAAREMLDNFDREAYGINKQLDEARKQLLKTPAEERQSLNDEIKHYENKLNDIGIRRQEVYDSMFTNPVDAVVMSHNVSTAIKAYDRDIESISKDIETAKSQFSELKAQGASPALLSSSKANVDLLIGKLRDIKSEREQVVDAISTGKIDSASAPYVPAAKSFIDMYDKRTEELMAKISDVKIKIADSNIETPAQKVILEKQLESYTTKLHNIKTDRENLSSSLLGVEGAASVKTAVYTSAAKFTLEAYAKETTQLNKENVTIEKTIAKLKKNDGNEAKIKKLEGKLETNKQRIETIKTDKKRVSDFLKNGPRMRRDDVLSAEYSRGHKAEVRDAMNKDLPTAENSKFFNSNANMKKVHQARMNKFARTYGGKFMRGFKGFVKREMREEEDLDTGLEISDNSYETGRVVGKHVSIVLMQKQLNELGLGKKSIKAELEMIGVVTGIGDVSKMSLKDIQKELADILGAKANTSLDKLQEMLLKNPGKLSMDSKQKLMEAISLKKKLNMKDIQLAQLALKDAGEFTRYSTKELKKMIADSSLSIDRRSRAEMALRYKKLSKWTNAASGRWKVTFNFIKDIFKKMMQNNEYLADVINLSGNAFTAYRIGKTTYNISKGVAKGTVKTVQKVAKPVSEVVGKAINGTRQMIVNHTAQNAMSNVGARQANLILKNSKKAAKAGANSGKFLSKVGAKIKQAAVAVKSGVVAIGKAITSVIAAIAGGSGAGIIALIVVAILMFGMIAILALSYIFGDESNNTNVPAMVEYLEDKNTALIESMADKETRAPETKDLRGYTIPGYTIIQTTYNDYEGEPCLVTNNTKEIVSMSAVFFQQDYSDNVKIYDYLDEVWEKSHKLTYTEEGPYGCGGTVCLQEGTLNLNPEAKGFNGAERYFSCTEDFYNDIHYDDCFMIESANEWRKYVDKNYSYRFPLESVNSYMFNGINKYYYDYSTGALTTKGYGCETTSGTFYCSSIADISNSEVQTNLVRATGIPYYDLVSQGGCSIRHGKSEGQPAYGCSNYYLETKYRDLSFSGLSKNGAYTFSWNPNTERYEFRDASTNTLYYFYGYGEWYGGKYAYTDDLTVWYSSERGSFTTVINYYVCKEYTCHGHNISYHYCPGNHKEPVCYGHVNLNANLEVYSFNKNMLFMLPIESDNGFLWDETDNIPWVKNIYEQDWNELYGVTVTSSLYDNLDGIGTVIMPTHANSLPIPLYNQLDYPNSPYGIYGTVASHGCGITCVAMLDSYYKDTQTSPAYLARIFGEYNTDDGSLWSLFHDSAQTLMLPFEQETESWSAVVQALQDGKPVVSIQGPGLFTKGGHFILLTGITPDGRILVNDPNGANYYKNDVLSSGFANGFTQQQIQAGSKGSYWIYGVKPNKTTQTTP
ncbi:MAG: C39 family peptidase [Acutalibacteraceae bacterium]|nr:C39 family peptidase [Acutalibacteraceae bacterium]